MASPPAWVKQTRNTAPYGQFSNAKGSMVAGLAAGVATSADVNKQPSNGGPMAPSKWAYIWFGLSVLYLLGVYSGNLSVAQGRV